MQMIIIWKMPLHGEQMGHYYLYNYMYITS